MDEKQLIQNLRRELEQANYEYYVLDNPSMSDYDFDHKLRQLEELEAKLARLENDLQSGKLVSAAAPSAAFTKRETSPAYQWSNP